jgi:hypothetical protein
MWWVAGTVANLAIGVATIAVAVHQRSQRRRHARLVPGATLLDDRRDRRRQALEINDDIVQGLAEAKLALQLDEREQSEAALTVTLAAASRIITDLLGESDETRLGAGDLRRSTAAGVTDRAAQPT